MRRTINVLLGAVIALTLLASTGNAAQSCCCPGHGQDSSCAMSCGPSESPEALQPAVPTVPKPTMTAYALPSEATLLELYPAKAFERFTTLPDESPPKRYLRNRLLRL